MYFIYLSKLNIIIPRHVYRYSCAAPANGYYLDLWRVINVLLFLLIIFIIICIAQCCVNEASVSGLGKLFGKVMWIWTIGAVG